MCECFAGKEFYKRINKVARNLDRNVILMVNITENVSSSGLRTKGKPEKENKLLSSLKNSEVKKVKRLCRIVESTKKHIYVTTYHIFEGNTA